MENPFKKETKSYTDFNTMSDGEWHCTKCELVSAQAKTYHNWEKNNVVKLKKDGENKFIRKFCIKCKKETIHRAIEN